MKVPFTRSLNHDVYGVKSRCLCMHPLYMWNWMVNFSVIFSFSFAILYSVRGKNQSRNLSLGESLSLRCSRRKKRNEWMNEWKRKKFADSSLSDASTVQQWIGSNKKQKSSLFRSEVWHFGVRVYLDQVFGSEITFLLSMIFIGYKLVCAKLLRRKFTYQ